MVSASFVRSLLCLSSVPGELLDRLVTGHDQILSRRVSNLRIHISLYLSVRNGQAETRFLSPVLQRACVLVLVQAALHWSLCPSVTSL